jgi:phage gp46-like protein
MASVDPEQLIQQTSVRVSWTSGYGSYASNTQTLIHTQPVRHTLNPVYSRLMWQAKTETSGFRGSFLLFNVRTIGSRVVLRRLKVSRQSDPLSCTLIKTLNKNFS